MKRLLPLLFLIATVGLIACDTTPRVMPNMSGDSAMTMKIKSDIENGKQVVTTGYAWILWYLPILFLVVAWGWREFIAKRPKDCPPVDAKKPVKKRKKPTESAPSSETPKSPSAPN